MTGPCMQAVMHVFKHDANGSTVHQSTKRRGSEDKADWQRKGRETGQGNGRTGVQPVQVEVPFFGVCVVNKPLSHGLRLLWLNLKHSMFKSFTSNHRRHNNIE